MKRYFRHIIILALITVLCIGIVSAAGSGTATGDKGANETTQIHTSLVSAPSEVNLADIKAMLPPEILQSVNEQITFNESITKAISEKEEQLVQSPLIINDSYDITGEVQGFFVGNTINASEPASSGLGLGQANISSSVILPVNQIPTEGFIAFGSDGKTRIFTSEGTQISYAVDDKSENVTIPSGKILPSTHIIGIPNGAASHSRGNSEYITIKGEVILTIIDQSSNDTLGDSIVPSTLSYPWVEYAESDPYYIAAVHSHWIIPHSPNLIVPAYNANILFNGIEPSNGSMIFQPVTAFNYYAHSSIIGSTNRTDPTIVNKWTGASWICPPDNNYCTHSNPVLSFSQGELAYGAVFWYDAPVSEWLVYLVNSSYQGTWQFSDQYDYSLPTRAVITYEYGGSVYLGGSPLDQDKITSTTFSNISVWDTNGNQISSLHWNGVVNTKDHKKTTGLNVDLSQAPSTVTLNTSDYRTKTGTYQNGFWNLDYNLDGISDKTSTLGTTGDVSVVGDWNGYNYSAIGVFRPSNGNWYLDTNKDFIADYNFQFGKNGDIPVVGDWNADSHSDVGVFRPSAGYWYLDTNKISGVEYAFQFGSSTDIPVVGDWDGNGISDAGVFRPSTGYWYLDTNKMSGVEYAFQFGSPTDIPVVGDWDGNGISDAGVYRPSTGYWYLDTNKMSGVEYAFQFGTSGDTPKVGKWV